MPLGILHILSINHFMKSHAGLHILQGSGFWTKLKKNPKTKVQKHSLRRCVFLSDE